MWIEGARRFAARGFACFRFDYLGAGDSEGESGPVDPNRPAREDIVAVLRHLRGPLGQRRFVLYGACFDGRTALSAFVDEGEAIEALVVVAAPVMELDLLLKLDADLRTWRRVGRAILRPDNWRAMLRPERWGYVARVIGRVTRRSVLGAQEERLPLSASFIQHFQALVASRARAFFLYGAADPEYATFRMAERTLVARLPAPVKARLEIEVWPGEVHAGFVEMTRQREVFARVADWIERLHPAAAGAPASADGRSPAEAAWTSA
jgi:pimeloyl-ACP methyl ester carboxylesterase